MTGETERREAAEQLALTLVGAGMQRMGARTIAAFMFTEKDSLTAGDLAEFLGVSAGSVSGAVRMVAQMGLIERIYVAGSRREHFRMLDNAWTTLYSRQHSVVDEVLRAVEKGVEAVGPGLAHDRLTYMRDFYTFLINEAPVLVERFERQRRGEPRS
ncbi:MarR family transcriptional regulator [Lentzea sp. BCCO 10_0061]|uniref:MarR family transcriptional regulator n=1 Tax=Lentzea sokolovensis TaxID=3095429 RepID=A0ABU4VAP8_9PSEU|nr:MarR family transcriptional regulator [Lentzea sp. BCCO 10_0061]MDX8147935.1 MarR family transcriptional regulator [Lentzea sp. BCCO 10_0061]